MTNNKCYKIREVAERLGVCIDTLRVWDGLGLLPARRTPGGHRRYLESDILQFESIQFKPKTKVIIL